jgi:hypothetical protein
MRTVMLYFFGGVHYDQAWLRASPPRAATPES